MSPAHIPGGLTDHERDLRDATKDLLAALDWHVPSAAAVRHASIEWRATRAAYERVMALLALLSRARSYRGVAGRCSRQRWGRSPPLFP